MLQSCIWRSQKFEKFLSGISFRLNSDMPEPLNQNFQECGRKTAVPRGADWLTCANCGRCASDVSPTNLAASVPHGVGGRLKAHWHAPAVIIMSWVRARSRRTPIVRAQSTISHPKGGMRSSTFHCAWQFALVYSMTIQK